MSKKQPKVTEFVLIGRKPLIRYVTACITVFNEGNKQLVIKARGEAISKAVDVAQIVLRKFVSSSKIVSIKIGTVTLPETSDSEHPRPKNISIMEIVIEK